MVWPIILALVKYHKAPVVETSRKGIVNQARCCNQIMSEGLSRIKNKALRRGWTTGACAIAATRAAYTALLTGHFPDPVQIILPKGHRPRFSLAYKSLGANFACVGIIKDAGDDPDVTHGALVRVTVRLNPIQGISFRAGEGVGIVTKAGLPIPVGEASISPVPRRLMRETIEELAAHYRQEGNVEIEISIPNGEALAKKTWNPRLGIVGGLSILGTTGVVIPYSCSAWIHSIQRGIDVARANGFEHVAGCTGSTSEAAVRALYALPESALLDMGDFVGGMLKYLRRYPVPWLTIGGGFGKLSKLAQGHLDLHSSRSQVDLDWLSAKLQHLRGPAHRVDNRQASSANELLVLAGNYQEALVGHVAKAARVTVERTLRGSTQVDVAIVDRTGRIIGRDHG